MMPAQELLQAARKRGLSLWAEGDRLRVRAAQGPIPSDLRELLTAQKAALLKLLHAESSPAEPLVPIPPPPAADPVPADQQPDPAPREWDQAPCQWDPDTAGRLEWFAGWTPPGEPFPLRPGCTVVDPALFVARLRGDISAGPDGPRARTGALQADLQALEARFGAASRPQAEGVA